MLTYYPIIPFKKRRTKNMAFDFFMNHAADPLAHKAHIRFFKQFLHLCPATLSAYDTIRATTTFFSICGLDILNSLDELPSNIRYDCIEWLYHLQVLPSGNPDDATICGFQGSSCTIMRQDEKKYESAHLAMTYTALATLITLGDDLSRVNKSAVISGVRALQQPDGSFCCAKDNEADMRFVYCAACISYILNDFSGIDLDRMVSFITESVSYEGGLGEGPHLESHGGSTFCGVAALALTSSLHKLSSRQIKNLRRWLISRQGEGFNGRPNKPEDTCYSFWVIGALALLDSLDWVNAEANRSLVMSTQDSVTGGLAKWPESRSDPLHTFFGLAGLSLMKEEGLAPIEPLLCITQRAHAHLKYLQSKW